MNFSFFRTRGGSGEIRGTQMAEYLGGRVNPQDDYENDICIYVKLQPPEDYPERSYLDIIDEPRRIKWLKKHPDIGVIASSQTGYEYLSGELENKVVLIPHHHCNYDRERTREKIAVGVVGGQGAIRNNEIKEKIEYIHFSEYKTRQDVVNAYKQIGIQIIWRNEDRPLKNPLKIINAASFGIPTIAYPEMAYEEVEGYYRSVTSVQEMIDVIGYLTAFTNYYRDGLVDFAEKYHIDNIAKLYKELL